MRPPLLAPIRATLRAMAADPQLPPMSGLAPSLTVRGDGHGWTSAADLVNGAALPDLLDAAVAHWPAARHVAASMAWRQYAYWLMVPALLGYAAARRVPLLHPANVRVRWSPMTPFLTIGLVRVGVAVTAADPLADGPSGRVRAVADDDSLLQTLRSSLLVAHLEPIMARLHDTLQLGRRTLRGSVASGVAHALGRAGRVVPDTGLATASRVLAALDLASLVDLDPQDGGFRIRRRTCCLGFKLERPKICTDCVLR